MNEQGQSHRVLTLFFTIEPFGNQFIPSFMSLTYTTTIYVTVTHNNVTFNVISKRS